MSSDSTLASGLTVKTPESVEALSKYWRECSTRFDERLSATRH
jgi:hypothetical protein